MFLYHGTNKECKENILKNGFLKNYGRFGEGAYFYKDLESASAWGKDIIKIEIDDIYVKSFIYENIASEYNVCIEEEEGIPELEHNSYNAIEILYNDGVSEICIYNIDIIKIIIDN